MNRQEVFDRVARYLLNQGVRAINAIGTCAYRGNGGMKCAIGVLIDDAAYTEALEGEVIGHALDSSDPIIDALERSGIEIEDDEDVLFMKGLQIIHDVDAPPAWPAYLREFANAHNLSLAVLDSISAEA